MLELRKLTKVFSDRQKEELTAVDSIDMSVPEGEVCALLGTSGSGKTTTLKMINRLIEPTSGEIFIHGQNVFDKPVNEMRKDIGYVIQSIGLFPNMTVFENITVVPRLLGWNKTECRKRAQELLSMVNLPTEASFLNRFPFQLSGGQSQRVGVMRALAARPSLLLMDEPFNAIDPLNRASIQEEFRKLQQKLGLTVVFVSHDLDEAIKVGDSIAVFDHGRIIQHDKVHKILKHPENSFVKDFLGDHRGLKVLSLSQVSDAFSRQNSSRGKSQPSIGLDESLAIALARLCLSETGELACLDSKGDAVGVINHEHIQNFLSR